MTLILRQALKLRYWVVTGVLGGGYLADSYYEKWKKSLPQFTLPEWIKYDERAQLISKRYEELRERWAEREGIDMRAWMAKINGTHLDWKRRAEEEAAGWLNHSAEPNLLYAAYADATGGAQESGGEGAANLRAS